ncbi:19683_t:CDS:2, partial [Dentiscutata erythropus]
GHIKRDCEELRKSIEFRQWQRSHRMQANNQAKIQSQNEKFSINEVLQEKVNIVHTLESEKEKAVNTISVGPEEEIGTENIAQRLQKVEEME